jgi:hypothetical protein
MRTTGGKGQRWVTIAPVTDTTPRKACLVCGGDNRQTPLVQLDYLDRPYWICPRHMPMLIHDPASLAGMLPGAETLQPADHHD